MTTERDAFDKASSRGKRKSAWQHGKSRTGYHGKRSKNSASEDSISACDKLWVNSDNITGNTTSNMRHLSKKTGPRLQNFSPHNPVNNNLTAKQLNLNECQSYNNSLSACGDLQLNSQNSLYKCNIYFAKATRDPFPMTEKVTSSISGDQEKGSISSSKWAKFISSSSTQTNLHENMMENNINPQSSFVSDRGLDNRKCNVSLIALSNCQQDSESLHSQTSNSIKPVPDTTRHVNVENNQSGSLLVQDLFKVDDDLDEEWWNSL